LRQTEATYLIKIKTNISSVFHLSHTPTTQPTPSMRAGQCHQPKTDNCNLSQTTGIFLMAENSNDNIGGVE